MALSSNGRFQVLEISAANKINMPNDWLPNYTVAFDKGIHPFKINENHQNIYVNINVSIISRGSIIKR